MNKVFVVAKREYRAMVATKGFIIAITLMPVMMFGGIFAHGFLEGRVGAEQKNIVVLDETGQLFDALSEAAQARNKNEIFDVETKKQIKPRYELEAGATGAVTDEIRFELSERIRSGEINAFVEIPVGISDMPSAADAPKVKFHAENTALSDEKRWLQWKLNDLVRTQRLKQAGLDPELVGQASMPVVVEGFGLVERRADGKLDQIERPHEAFAIFLPFGLMLLMFMVILMTSQPMLESVMEEKSQRIAEVLLGSVNPSQLMLGKLFGGVAGSLTILATYGLGAYAVAHYYDVVHLIPMRIVPWFIVYQVMAVALFGSVFMAIGASVNHLKEAQGMLMPVWLVLWSPMIVWLQIVREPTGAFATWLSFVPTATPMLMVLRMSASTAIPIWQPILGVVLLLAATLVGVMAAARIFRIGILAQGKTPKISQLVRWAVTG